MRNRRISISANYFAEALFRFMEVALLQSSKSQIQLRHDVVFVSRQYLLELRGPLLSMSAVHQHDSIIVASVEVGCVEFHGARVCVERFGFAAAVLRRDAKLVPGFGMGAIECGCNPQ